MATTYKASRVNLCTPVRKLLVLNNISTVRVVDAINSALGELNITSEDAKNGKGNVTKEAYRTSVNVSIKFKGERNLPLEFDAWHGRIESALKISEFEFGGLPERFAVWLKKFENKNTEQPTPEQPVEA